MSKLITKISGWGFSISSSSDFTSSRFSKTSID